MFEKVCYMTGSGRGNVLICISKFLLLIDGLVGITLTKTQATLKLLSFLKKWRIRTAYYPILRKGGSTTMLDLKYVASRIIVYCVEALCIASRLVICGKNLSPSLIDILFLLLMDVC